MFYLTLPSNSSMALFPDNTLSDYTTQLPRDCFSRFVGGCGFRNYVPQKSGTILPTVASIT